MTCTFNSGPGIHDLSGCLLNLCHYVIPSCCDSCPYTKSTPHISKSIPICLFSVRGPRGRVFWVVEVHWLTDILSISLTGKPNTQMNECCFLFGCKTRPLLRMVNFHVHMDKIPFPNIPTPETNAVYIWLWNPGTSPLMSMYSVSVCEFSFLCKFSWSKLLKLNMDNMWRPQVLEPLEARLKLGKYNFLKEIRDFLPMKSFINDPWSSLAIIFAAENSSWHM